MLLKLILNPINTPITTDMPIFTEISLLSSIFQNDKYSIRIKNSICLFKKKKFSFKTSMSFSIL